MWRSIVLWLWGMPWWRYIPLCNTSIILYGAVEMLLNHRSGGGRVQAKVRQLFTIYRGGDGGEALYFYNRAFTYKQCKGGGDTQKKYISQKWSGPNPTLLPFSANVIISSTSPLSLSVMSAFAQPPTLCRASFVNIFNATLFLNNKLFGIKYIIGLMS